MKNLKNVFFAILMCSVVSNVYALDHFTLAGKKIEDSQLLKEDRTIIKFWTTWCPYCSRQLNFFKHKIAKLEKEGVKVYLVNVGEDQAKVVRFADKLKLPKDNIVLNKNSSLARRFAIMGYPTYVFFYKGRELTRANVLNDDSLEQLLEVYDSLEQ